MMLFLAFKLSIKKLIILFIIHQTLPIKKYMDFLLMVLKKVIGIMNH